MSSDFLDLERDRPTTAGAIRALRESALHDQSGVTRQAQFLSETLNA